MIKKYSLLALQKAINHTLALDASIPGKLQHLDNKVLEIIISPLDVHFYIRFTLEGVRLLDSYDGEPNASIHSSPLGLIRLSILPSSKVRSLFNDKIRISGDVELGQHVKQLFDELDIDWEGHLAQFTGDVVAYQVGNIVRKGLALKQQVGDSLIHNVTEFLQEEYRAFPTKEEVHDFFGDVDALSLSTERLAAQVNHLLAQHETD